MVALNLHPAAAAIALLAAPEFAVDKGEVDGKARREAGEIGDERLPMGLTRRGKSKHNKGL